MSGAIRLVTAQSPGAPWWPWPVTGSGWWLKYQKMRSGGCGEATVQLMVCEEPTLRYTDFSPTIEHLGSAMKKCQNFLKSPRLSNISLVLTHLGPRGASCDLYGAPCSPGTRKVRSLTRGCSEDTRTMGAINRWIETGLSTDQDSERVSADGGLHRHRHPLIFGEHELPHRQQTRLRSLVIQSHPGHLIILYNVV